MNSNPTKRFFCRVIFIALGLLPLLGTVSWATYRGLYQTNASYASEIGKHLGLGCDVERAIHVRPGVIRFEGLKLRDTEGLEILGHCDEATLHSSPFDREIRISALSVSDVHFRRLLELLDERVLQNPRMLQLQTAIQIDRLTIDSAGSSAVIFDDVRIVASLSNVGPQANAEFTLIPANESSGVANEPIRLDVIRELAQHGSGDGEPSIPVTRLNLITGNATLPCSLLAGFFGSHHLNPDATFEGNIHLVSDSHQSAAWTGDAYGHLENLQLQEICSIATGNAKLTFRKATFDKGVATLLDGTLAVNGGKLQSGFVHSAIENLGITIADSHRSQLANPDGLIPFDAINIDFVVEDGESTLRGTAPSAPTGSMGTINGESLFVQPKSKVRNVDLLRTLLGLSQDQVPIANDSTLLRAFPQ